MLDSSPNTCINQIQVYRQEYTGHGSYVMQYILYVYLYREVC